MEKYEYDNHPYDFDKYDMEKIMSMEKLVCIAFKNLEYHQNDCFYHKVLAKFSRNDYQKSANILYVMDNKPIIIKKYITFKNKSKFGITYQNPSHRLGNKDVRYSGITRVVDYFIFEYIEDGPRKAVYFEQLIKTLIGLLNMNYYKKTSASQEYTTMTGNDLIYFIKYLIYQFKESKEKYGKFIHRLEKKYIKYKKENPDEFPDDSD